MNNKPLVFTSILSLLIISGVSLFGFDLYKKNVSLEQSLFEKEADFNQKIEANALKFEEQEEIIALLEKNLEEEKDAYDDLDDSFKDLENQIKKINKSVGTLEKLKDTDPELLAKYSKVFFLNEHYAPKNISSLGKDALYNENSDITISSQVLPFLEDLMDEAEDDGQELLVLSGYRSFQKQQAIKQSYVNSYGQQAADTFSADQGLSEHQLGTTIDFTTKDLGANLSAFVNSSQYQWLVDNAYKYGFVLSYPESNSFYQFEPWHWRFVGKDLARDLRKDEKFLYDVPQRELDKYLAEIFD